MKPLRIGLIGAGQHGSRYAKHIVEDLPQAELAAVCRRDRQEGEKLATSYGCSFYQHGLLAARQCSFLTPGNLGL